MKTVYAAIGVLAILALLAGHAVWRAGEMLSIPATSAEITARPAADGGEPSGPSPLVGGDTGGPQIDLLGNEVERAIADYRVDLGGAIYERHAPDVAVPRLGAPVM